MTNQKPEIRCDEKGCFIVLNEHFAKIFLEQIFSGILQQFGIDKGCSIIDEAIKASIENPDDFRIYPEDILAKIESKIKEEQGD